MAEHTPGPWGWCGSERGGCTCFTVSAPEHPIAHVEHGEWGDEYVNIRLVDSEDGINKVAEPFMDHTWYGSIDEDVAKANARLIAAAPDLLAVVKRAYGLLHGGSLAVTAPWSDLIKALESTVILATGEKP